MKREESHRPSGVSSIANGTLASSGCACQHTLYHSDALGNLLGSWQAVPVGNRMRIECRVCGKFFSYLVEQVESQDEACDSNRIGGLA